ncbi:hypothetical protein [Deinococcus roseus]|uniref:hypothetical protein n=1 Tax=Deinococcus roseus TaxID=392414 RepID=UPI001662FC83|nr:hypothetical protein [Deinococcus roseus]
MNLDNGTIGGGSTTPSSKDPRITSVTINGNQLLGQTGDVWISGDADVFVKAASNEGLKSLTYSIAGQTGSVENPKAINSFRVSNLTSGSKTLKITITNNKNVSDEVSLPVKVDLTPPTVNVLEPAGASAGGIPRVSGVVTLKVSVADGESGLDSVRFYQTGEDAQEITKVTRVNDEYSVQIDTTKLTDGVKYFQVDSRNNAGLLTSKIVGLNVGNTAEPPAPTAPVVRLLLAPGEKSNTVTIPFIISSEDNLKVAKLLVDGELFKTIVAPPANTENTFTLDVNLLTVGTHVVTIEATTVKEKSATSNGVTIQITKNLSLPLFVISSPTEGASLSGKTPIEVSVVKKGSDFKFLSDITVQIIDFTGNVVKTLTIDKANLKDTDGIYLTELVDWTRLTGADNYSIRASAQVEVDDGTPAANPTFQLEDQLTTGVTITNRRPPAANILLPSSNDASSAVPNAVFSRLSGLFLMSTDETGNFRVDVRMIRKDGNGGGKVTKYLYNLPWPGGFYKLIPEVFLDGSEKVEDGNYMLQTVTEDIDGNGNVQEIPVTVNRAAPALNGLAQNADVKTLTIRNPFKPGDLNVFSTTWQLCNNPNDVVPISYELGGVVPTPKDSEKCAPVTFTNPTTVASVVIKDNVTVVSKAINFAYTGVYSPYTYGFSSVGDYQHFVIAQDLITGVVQVFTGANVGVTQYRNN